MMKNIPLSIPNFGGNEKKYVDQAIEETWVSTGGAYINSLEEELARFLGASKVAACQSGTSAIHLALIDAGVTYEDIVIVPTLTFIAAVNPVMYQMAHPVFMDCDDSLCMDPMKLRSFIENECQFDGEQLTYKERVVKALVVVHVFGNMADMESIMSLAEKYKIAVIEDATEALGTRYTEGKYKGKYAGTIGDYGAFSFNGNKIITTGGGGAVTSSSSEKVNHMKYLSTQAKDDAMYYIHNEIGYNYRMTNLQAALGVAQLEQLGSFIETKNENYEYYKAKLEGCPNVSLMDFRIGTFSNKWFYSLNIDIDSLKCSLHEIIEKLKEKGIQTRAIWGLIHLQKPYLQSANYDIVKAQYYRERILNIPCSTNLQKDEIEYVTNCIKEIVR